MALDETSKLPLRIDDISTAETQDFPIVIPQKGILSPNRRGLPNMCRRFEGVTRRHFSRGNCDVNRNTLVPAFLHASVGGTGESILQPSLARKALNHLSF